MAIKEKHAAAIAEEAIILATDNSPDIVATLKREVGDVFMTTVKCIIYPLYSSQLTKLGHDKLPTKYNVSRIMKLFSCHIHVIIYVMIRLN